jgi:HAMP domain-containing protein
VADFDPDTAWDAVARYDVVLATLQLFTERSLATRVTVLLDQGDGIAATMLECEPGEPLSLTEAGETYLVPPEALLGVAPLPMSPPRPVPATAIDFDLESGQVMAPLGAVAALSLAVLELARVMGGRSVATADFATRDGEPITIAAREGEPMIMAIGDEQFELPVPPSL